VLTAGSGIFPAPTPAHAAVADLVVGGWVKVVVTTNFDPLTEQAVEKAGGAITVLSTEDQVAGALPLVHSGPILLKVHGDYRDSRIRNTESELQAYTPAIEKLLDRIFDEYGLIVCGWSAENDAGLRAAIDRCPSRRFGTYWGARGGRLSDAASQLLDRRQGEVIVIDDADGFLGRLADGVKALRATHAAPMNTSMEIASIKRELRGDGVAITTHDHLLHAFGEITEMVASIPADASGSEHRSTLDAMTGQLEHVAALVSTVSYWGSAATDRWWTEEISRTSRWRHLGGTTSMLDLAKVPGLVTLWSAGVAATATGRSDLLTRLMRLPTVRDPYKGAPANPLDLLSVGVVGVGHPVKWLYHRLRPAFVENLGMTRGSFADAFERWQLCLEVWSGLAGAVRGEALLRIEADTEQLPPAYHWLLGSLRELGEESPLVLATRSPANYVEQAAKDAIARLHETYNSMDWGQLPQGGGILPSGTHFPGSFTDDADVYFAYPG